MSLKVFLSLSVSDSDLIMIFERALSLNGVLAELNPSSICYCFSLRKGEAAA